MVEANRMIRLPDETGDFDLAWVSENADSDEQRDWDMLKAVDPTFTKNSGHGFQARNSRAYEVELLVAPPRAATLGSKDLPRPVPLPEQEWLLLGRPVDQVVGCRDGSPAHIALGDDLEAAATCVIIMRDRGLFMKTLYMELLEPTARYLGEMWNKDDCDFVDVTIGVGRLQKPREGRYDRGR
jgi:hypothetical protein